MDDFSLLQKLKVLVGLIATSPLFLFFCMLSIAILIFFIICVKRDIKINKLLFILVWVIMLSILVVNYSNLFLNLVDNLFNTIFMALYFPNLTVYIIILLISNVTFIYSLFSKNLQKSYKILNIVNCIVINIFLVLIIDIINRNGINVYESLTVFSNSSLLILLELTTAVFTSWILLNLLLSAYNKLKVYDTKSLPDMPEILFDESD